MNKYASDVFELEKDEPIHLKVEFASVVHRRMSMHDARGESHQTLFAIKSS